VADLDFEQVVSQHYVMLYRFALSLSGNETEACDLTQQTFYAWATKGHQLRDPSKLRSWLLTTLHREFLGARRHENRFPHVEVGAVAHELPPVAPQMIDQMDAHTLLSKLVEVDEVYRVPLSLFYFEDMSYKEIADALDVPAGTVMSRIARGKEQLRRLMAVRADELRAKILPLKTALPHNHTTQHG
jgi:RNA polymerase sigma-70 factor (ECF subfamily)